MASWLLFFISPTVGVGLGPSFPPPIQRTADLSNAARALSFDAIAFFAPNAGMPMTASEVGADGITHLYNWLGGEPTGEPTHNNTSHYSSGDILIASRPMDYIPGWSYLPIKNLGSQKK